MKGIGRGTERRRKEGAAESVKGEERALPGRYCLGE